ncbi:hypothetical protein AX17_004756 [Amanita inopinata Kibby_2008]|nr:hypothetical protein AX17_004756 [Amanita inopinata Kibby_2008]
MPKLKIAIIGAGIGGLTLASAIGHLDKHKSIEIDVYESAAILAEIGAGINIWLRAWKLLKDIGLEEDLLQLVTEAPDEEGGDALIFEFRKGDQKKGRSILDMYAKGGIIRLHRAHLQQVLLKHASALCRLHVSSRLVSYTEHDDGVHLAFEDGSTRTCDLLVGADGIKSTVRRVFLRGKQQQQNGNHGRNGYDECGDGDGEPVWSGTYAYRGLVSREALEKKVCGHRATKVPVMYCGKRKHIAVYPVSQGQLVNVVACVHDPSKEHTRYQGPPVCDVSREELLSMYKHWEPEVQALLECIPKPSRWAIHCLKPLETYARGRVLLLGDAAHAMTPHQGAGAGQAMEDAYVLAHLLLSQPDLDLLHSPSHIPLITHVFNAIRQPFGNHAVRMSRTCGKLSDLTDEDLEFPEFEEGDETVGQEVLVGLIRKMERQWQWLWEAPVEEECRRASRMLRELYVSGGWSG